MTGIAYRLLPILVLLSVPCEALIFETDDRRSAPNNDTRFQSIGLVKSSNGYGTGFLVDDCHVLTSRHVQSENGTVIGSRMTFSPHGHFSVRPVKGIVIASGKAPPNEGRAGPNRDRRNDWLLLKLDSCIGAKLGFLSLPAEPVRIGAPLMNAGFPVDRPKREGPSIDPTCTIHYITNVGALHDCAFLAGNSGGPLFDSTLEGGRITLRAVAIGSAGFHRSQSSDFTAERANVGTLITPLLPLLRSYLRPVFPGTPLNDHFRGSGLIDRLIGGVGDDTFVLDRNGGDALVGGPGKDRFQLTGSSGNMHRIEDFDPEEGDVLDFSAIDADDTIAGKQRFRQMQMFHGEKFGTASLVCSPDQNLILRLYVKHRGEARPMPDYQLSLGQCRSTVTGMIGVI